MKSHQARAAAKTFVNYTQTLTPDNDPLDLFIEAQDGHEHEEYVQFRLIIALQDVNDNHPRITPALQSSYVIPEVCTSRALACY